MRESESYEETALELMKFMQEQAQELDYPVVQRELEKFAGRCWCPIPEADSEEDVMDNFFYLRGWLDSRIQLSEEGLFRKCQSGAPFSHVFKEVAQKERDKK